MLLSPLGKHSLSRVQVFDMYIPAIRNRFVCQRRKKKSCFPDTPTCARVSAMDSVNKAVMTALTVTAIIQWLNSYKVFLCVLDVSSGLQDNRGTFAQAVYVFPIHLPCLMCFSLVHSFIVPTSIDFFFLFINVAAVSLFGHDCPIDLL